jgi:hypothetical protein
LLGFVNFGDRIPRISTPDLEWISNRSGHRGTRQQLRAMARRALVCALDHPAARTLLTRWSVMPADVLRPAFARTGDWWRLIFTTTIDVTIADLAARGYFEQIPKDSPDAVGFDGYRLIVDGVRDLVESGKIERLRLCPCGGFFMQHRRGQKFHTDTCRRWHRHPAAKQRREIDREPAHLRDARRTLLAIHERASTRRPS